MPRWAWSGRTPNAQSRQVQRRWLLVETRTHNASLARFCVARTNTHRVVIVREWFGWKTTTAHVSSYTHWNASYRILILQLHAAPIIPPSNRFYLTLHKTDMPLLYLSVDDLSERKLLCSTRLFRNVFIAYVRRGRTSPRNIEIKTNYIRKYSMLLCNNYFWKTNVNA